ncbi:MAG: hypothetical protein P1U65_01220 [Minwuia sp.]|nr:hypothetical protein [Minwuia sp.]
MHRLAGLIAALIVLASIQTAQAGWRYAQWGMSPDELVAAAGGGAVRHYEPAPERWGEYPSAKGKVREMGQDFEVWFYTDPYDGLYMIRLVPTGLYWCIDVRESAMARWGYDVRFNDGDPYWNDRRNELRASVIGFRGCTVKLEPLFE